jgi:hypothetical protein
LDDVGGGHDLAEKCPQNCEGHGSRMKANISEGTKEKNSEEAGY